MNVKDMFEKYPFFVVFRNPEEKEKFRELCEKYDDPLVDEVRGLDWEEVERLYMEGAIKILESGGDFEEYNTRFFMAALCKAVFSDDVDGFERFKDATLFIRGEWQRVRDGIRAYKTIE